MSLRYGTLSTASFQDYSCLFGFTSCVLRILLINKVTKNNWNEDNRYCPGPNTPNPVPLNSKPVSPKPATRNPRPLSLNPLRP